VVSLKTGAVKTLLKGGYFGRYLQTNGSNVSACHLVYLGRGVLNAVAFNPVRPEVQGSPEQILGDVLVAATQQPIMTRHSTFRGTESLSISQESQPNRNGPSF
jgi:hypothetical protein